MIMKGRYELIYISIPLVIIAYLFANKFTVAGMGEEFAINLGLNYKTSSQYWIESCCTDDITVVFNSGNDSFSRIDYSQYCFYLYWVIICKKSFSYSIAWSRFILICDIFGPDSYLSI